MGFRLDPDDGSLHGFHARSPIELMYHLTAYAIELMHQLAG